MKKPRKTFRRKLPCGYSMNAHWDGEDFMLYIEPVLGRVTFQILPYMQTVKALHDLADWMESWMSFNNSNKGG